MTLLYASGPILGSTEVWRKEPSAGGSLAPSER